MSGDGRAPDGGSDPDDCETCNTPPTACHALTGTCEAGACQYAFVEDAPCDDANACTVADTCASGGCSGTPKVCNAAPANVCISGTQLKAYDLTGACTGGLCTYNSQTITCASSCVNGACTTDPCANVTCNTPPSGCFASPGVCQNGSCTYPYANGATCNDSNACTSNDVCQTGVCLGAPMSCNTPPPSVCENATTLKLYSAAGTCSLGSCSYGYGFASCANGCANGQCNLTGWTIMNSNVTVELKTVWASSSASAWAGGANGTLVYYNGAQWQVRTSGTTQEIVQIHGTTANNVFAFAGTYQSQLLHYDGASWSPVATLPLYYTYSIFAIGTKDVLAFGQTNSTSSNGDTLLRIQYTGGTWQTTTLKQGTVFRKPNFSYRMWAESPTSVYLPGGNFWDGQAVTPLGPATYFGRGPGRMWKSGSLVLGMDWQNGATVMYQYQPTTSTWTPMATGFAGTIEDFHGPSANRIFIVGYTSNPSTGHVLYYDGNGWTSMQLPAGVGRLTSVWALASGEVFAVGAAGRIVSGP
ncbi:MAG TPA: hypothetical protein VIV11_17030 [Kofleriaceae bacterium]